MKTSFQFSVFSFQRGSASRRPASALNWKDYFELLMEFEGTVYENVPGDNGGPTKYGIDQRSHPTVNIRQLTKQAAELIYLQEWDKSFAAHLPSPLSFAYFDLRVNGGEGRAAKTIQRALGVKDDGVAGPKTLAAAQAMIARGEMGKLLLKFSSERELFYMNLAHTNSRMGQFLKGWLGRAKAMHQWATARLADTAQPLKRGGVEMLKGDPAALRAGMSPLNPSTSSSSQPSKGGAA